MKLTDEQIDAEWRVHASKEGFTTAQFVRNFARAIEAAVREQCAQVVAEQDDMIPPEVIADLLRKGLNHVE